MAINFKPINEVPTIEALSDGDTLLVNSGGTAKQIDASLVGGSGGGTVIYIKDYTEGTDMVTGSPCKDAELTQVMTTEELLAAFAAGPVVLSVTMDSIPAWMHPCVTLNQGGTLISILLIGEAKQFVYLCSDTSA